MIISFVAVIVVFFSLFTYALGIKYFNCVQSTHRKKKMTAIEAERWGMCITKQLKKYNIHFE